MSNLQTEAECNTPNADAEQVPCSFWGCCRMVPQRYVFIIVSMFGSMCHVVMSLSMSMAIVAMVKNDPTNNTTDSDSSNVCPYNYGNDTDSSSTSEDGNFDWDEMTQSYVLIAANVGSVFSGVIGARIAEIWSPKMMYGITNVGSAICNILLPLAAKWNVAALITLRAIQGFINGPMQAIHSILLAVWVPPKERTRLGGFYYSAEALGTIISMFLTGILISHYGWESVFYIYAVADLLWCVTWFVFVYDSPMSHPGISDKEREYIVTNVPRNNNMTYPVPWLKILTSPPLWAHVAMVCGNMWILYILLMEVPTYLNNMLHYNTKKTGYIATLPMVTTFLGCVTFAILSQWLRRRKYLSHITAYRVFNAITTIGPAAALIAIPQVGCDAISIVVLLVITSGLNSALIGGSVYNLMDLGINFTGTTSGISWMATHITSIIAPVTASSITNDNQTVSAWSTVFYVSAGVALFPYIIFFIFGSTKEQPWNKPVTESKENLDSTNSLPEDTENHTLIF